MALDPNLAQREFDKFIEDTGGDTAVRVVNVSAAGGAQDVIVKNALVTVEFDAITATFPTTSSEVYAYKTGGTSGTTVATVTVVYTDDTKEFISSVEVT